MFKELRIFQTITPRDSESLQRYLTDINTIPLLTPDEEFELALLVRQHNEEAREKLIISNLRFVVSIAKQYQNSLLDLIDLINEGNIGLMRAVDRFDPTRGFKFDTFAVWWIRQAISQALAADGRMVRLPVNIVGHINRIRKAAADFEQRNERQPTMEELCELVHLPVEKIEEYTAVAGKSVSIDEPLTDDSETTIADMLIDYTYQPTDATLMTESMHQELYRAMQSLPKREQLILTLYYGFDGQEHSMDDIAAELHLTRERVRQLRDVALRNIFNHHGAKLMRAMA